MNRDPIDERSAQLFAEARSESPSDETRTRILKAVQERPHTVLISGHFPWSRFRIRWALAAAALSGLVLLLIQAAPKPFEIAAEPPTTGTAERANPETSSRATPSENISAQSHPSGTRQDRAEPKNAPRSPAKPAPPSLEQELAGMQRARAALDAGDAVGALSELQRFDRNSGFRRLAVEANLLRIEALAKAGRTEESRAEARQFVEKNPHNPLVNRAEKLAQPPASPHADPSLKPERE